MVTTQALNSGDSKNINIMQTAGFINGNDTGIRASNYGNGSTIISTAAEVTGREQYGIYVYNSGDSQDIKITQTAGFIEGEYTGIRASNYGNGSTIINTADEVTGRIQYGIYVYNSGDSQDINITQTAGFITGGKTGINANNYGQDLIITQESGGSIEGKEHGIYVVNQGTGSTNITIGGNTRGGLSAIHLDDIKSGQAAVNITDTGIVRNMSGAANDLAISVGDKDFRTDINNSGLLTGTVQLGDVGNSFQNIGTWDTAGGINEFGAGANAFTNDGLVLAAKSGVSAKTEFKDMTQFKNNAGGVLSMANGIAGDRTVIHGDYVGNGGIVNFDTVLGDDSSATDLLQIKGSVSGNSFVAVNNVGGTGAQTVKGIKIIEVQGNSASDGFTLIGDYEHNGKPVVASGAFAYKLYQNGVDTPNDGDWYLRSSLLDEDKDKDEDEENDKD